MMVNGRDAQQKIDVFLGRLRERLRGMNAKDAREIVVELRSHIVDKATANGQLSPAGVDAALAALGTPEDLAGEYLTEYLMARAEVSRSPLRILESLFRWATLSVVGFFVLLGAIIGYVLGVAFLLAAVLKPFHPATAGLWIVPDGISLRMGFGSVPSDGKEILGWWMVPVGLVVGGGLVILTMLGARWCVRQYRKSRAFPPRG